MIQEKKSTWASVQRKLWAFLWVGAAVFLWLLFKPFHTFWNKQLYNGFFLSIAGVLFLVQIAIMAYFVLYVYYQKGTSDFSKHSPNTVLVGTVSGIAFLLSFVMGAWPAYGIWTIPWVVVNLFAFVHFFELISW